MKPLCNLSLLLLIHFSNLNGQVTFTDSNLPIIVIDTQGEEILKEPKINAHMGIIYNGEAARNFVSDAPNDYNGQIGIELRGSSSLFLFPKVGYAIETRLENGENNNVSLLGLPKENDWVLYGPYSDKTLIRNALAYKIAGSMMDYAPRTRFCELVLNEEYLGVYMLTEKIKRDANRVNISKLRAEENEGDDVTGGYILKFDKSDGGFNDGFESKHTSIPLQLRFPVFQYHYPKPAEITAAQKSYIQGFIRAFEDVLASDNFADPTTGYRQYIDVTTFIDYMLIQEVSKNVDAYRLSTFMYKDKKSIDNRLKLGPVWDFNLAFGNANFCNGSSWAGWAWNFNLVCPDDFWVIHFWWQRFREDKAFLAQTQERWRALRQDILKTETLMSDIDALSNELSEAQSRNFRQWDILTSYIWPNTYVGRAYANEIIFLKDWLRQRLEWMDTQIELFEIVCYEPDAFFEPFVYPNPSRAALTFAFYAPSLLPVRIQIFNTQGQFLEELKNIPHVNNRTDYTWQHDLPKGAYFYRTYIGEFVRPIGKFLVQ